ncbi:helix-turn-helix transcriptional regulator [Roseivirga echinicomitans]
MQEERLKVLDGLIASGYCSDVGYRRDDILEKLNERVNRPISLRQFSEDLKKLMRMAEGDGVTLNTEYKGVQKFGNPVTSKSGNSGAENAGSGLSRTRYIVYKYSKPKYSVYGTGLNNEDMGILVLASSIITSISGLEISQELQVIVKDLNKKVGLGELTELSTIIEFDENPELKGLEFLPVIIRAIMDKKVIRLTYQDFHKRKFIMYVHPYFLKIYRSRYYLFGWNEDAAMIHNYPLDRIQEVEPEFMSRKIEYNRSRKINPNEHLKDVVGVSVYMEKEVQEIRFKVNKERRSYLFTKPIHASQKYNEFTKTFSISVRPNRELESELRYCGAILITKNIDFEPPKKAT